MQAALYAAGMREQHEIDPDEAKFIIKQYKKDNAPTKKRAADKAPRKADLKSTIAGPTDESEPMRVKIFAGDKITPARRSTTKAKRPFPTPIDATPAASTGGKYDDDEGFNILSPEDMREEENIRQQFFQEAVTKAIELGHSNDPDDLEDLKEQIKNITNMPYAARNALFQELKKPLSPGRALVWEGSLEWAAFLEKHFEEETRRKLKRACEGEIKNKSSQYNPK